MGALCDKTTENEHLRCTLFGGCGGSVVVVLLLAVIVVLVLKGWYGTSETAVEVCVCAAYMIAAEI